MNAFATILLSLVSLAISFTVSFFLIKGAVRSAMTSILNRYSTPGRMEEELKKIGETLRQIQTSLAANPASANAPASGLGAASHDKIALGDAGSFNLDAPAKLIPGEGDTGVCSHCGKTQRNNRRICLSCSATFAKQTDDAETETE